MTQSDPTVRSQELGDELRTLREANALSLVDAARRIDASGSKLSRIETGISAPSAEDVSGLLVLYGVNGEKRRELLALARESERRGWWQRNHPGFAERQRTLVSLEAKADSIVNFEPIVVPGLLQTGEYTRAIMRDSGVVPEPQIEARMVTRLHRHAVLRREHPPKLLAVMDELVLKRPIGGPEVLRRQIEYLLEACTMPNVTIRIVPNDGRAHAGVDGAFTVLRRSGMSAVIFAETLTSCLFLEDKAEIETYEYVLRTLSERALDQRGSIALMADLARRLDSEESGT
ncbi:helix-turn-helix domain-containing protein [Saccharopolyspora erythraea]|uniref:helix-turn-helix domain-containing protein n=1 Tax=Saccharopolyspora erythraea TaxID=1836 RepID=UPI001BA4F520|nr:helix-turn-helix transcriptional regulator [Saccharopolyspora erythraea]QUH00606.1 helix-turn-helix domain-containing protein [Saccharopolyspora erythraea]